MFRYSCFLSYQRGNDLLDRFVRELFQDLSDELGLMTPLKVWFDTAMAPGVMWQPALEEAVTMSVCMVPVLTPTYFSMEKLYCAREYLAMERIEKARNQITQQKDSLILPVIFRGSRHLPEFIQNRQTLDFSEYLAFGSKQFRSANFAKGVKQLADRIAKLSATFMDLEKSKNLDQLKTTLPSDQEVLEWLDAATSRRALDAPINVG
ncbi:MAG TPA: toll/interleukin-1 receptor domain-containing protein [Pyrinomonadaceae bacterium]|nr:toll/interleukin-1 receptor domain-containing protein [Pyrinomonadaceae bacterium]